MSKSANLQIAQDAGLAVPSFFVVPHSVQESMLTDFIEENLISSDLSDTVQFSVRSSASVEDSGIQSFAGQFDSFLRVTRDDLKQRIIACRAALTKQSVRKYSHAADDNFVMDVIVQRMIDATVSGVVFTANPSGMLNEAVVSVSHGAGSAVTDDALVTTYYYHLDDNIFYFDQANNAPLLSDAVLQKTIELARQCMKLFGRYIDIEVAYTDTELWLLQVRPITSINTDDLAVFDNNNLVESYPGISLPLTQSFVTEAYTQIFKRLLERSIGKRSTRRYATLLEHMVRPLNGRMYYQVSSWSDILQLLPLRHKIIPVWQEMVGVDIRALPKQVVPRNFDRCKVLFGICIGMMVLPFRMHRLHSRFMQIEASFRRIPIHALSHGQLLAQYELVTKKIVNQWDLTLANDLYAFVGTGVYRHFAGHKASLICDRELPSSRLSAEFEALAHELRSSSLLNMRPAELQRTLDAADTHEAQLLVSYITCYGDRSPEELKLESRTFRTNPELLIAQLKSFQTVTSASKQPAPPYRQGLFTRVLRKWASVGIYYREVSRLDRTRIFGIVRTLMLEIGERLVAEGRLDDVRDVFYLTLDDMRVHSTKSFHMIITERKVRYTAVAALPAYTRLVFPSYQIVEKPLYMNGKVALTENGAILRGTPCSPGMVEGEAIIITDPSTSQDLEGKIIVTETTDPGWVFVLSRAKGIVVERGSLLSHTAIISRELRLPAVVGVINATRHISSGDRIRIDGLAGTVEILS